ncbi:glycosyltransferase family 2 protein [Oceanobacillus saliphilus]|uniref:glycosyltransferase family 2 protein n=1 Tax=Oceanobacillus saliphilus TaxID=2925834 RepID=UPI00201DCAFD|nr:glycosyltransferase [Oceanobacillus saliphilus]
MVRLSFIILHYKKYEDTFQCVKSINKANLHENNVVIIVDNGSGNDSGERLRKEYKDNKEIHVLTNSQNLGFAKGLNVGIEYSRKLFPNNFVVLLNSDTEIISGNWNEVISHKYDKYQFHVMGPDILNLDGITHGNPRKTKKYNLLTINYMLWIKYIELILLYLHIDIIEIYIKMKNWLSSKVIKERSDKINNDLINVELQGSCLILSSSYLDKYNGLNDQTFLYFEEAILKYIAERDGLVMLYTPDISILHKEYGSTMQVVSSSWERKMFIMRHGIKSRKVMRSLIYKDLLSINKSEG